MVQLPKHILNENKMENLGKLARFAFTIVCFIALGAVSLLQVRKFLRNSDSSTISFNKFTNERYPTYTICFEDNDNVGGIYKILYIHGLETKVYFDGETLRLDKSNMSRVDWQEKWSPNITDLDINSLVKQTRPIFLPLMIHYQSSEHLVHLIAFNESYMIPPAYFKQLLKGVDKSTFEIQLDPLYVHESEWDSFNVTYPRQMVSKINFEDVTIKLEDFLEEYTGETTENLKIGYVDDEYRKMETNCFMPEFLCSKQLALKKKMDQKSKIDFPFRLSYQDPTKICYTPKLNDSFVSVHDYVTLDLGEMMKQLTKVNSRNSELPYLRIYIHKKGQLLRSMGKDVANYATPDLLNEHCEFITGLYTSTEERLQLCYGSKVSFLMSQVTLLKKRHNAVNTCNQDLENEDGQIMMSIVNKIGCFPSYWKNFRKENNLNVSVCKTSNDYKEIYKYVSSIELSRSLFVPPCEDMIVVTNIMKERGRRREEKWLDPKTQKMVSLLDLEFIQGNEMYQEIDNVRDFTLESCWSAIGGFVGIFVGYSLLQLPELFVKYCQWLNKKVLSNLQRAKNSEFDAEDGRM